MRATMRPRSAAANWPMRRPPVKSRSRAGAEKAPASARSIRSPEVLLERYNLAQAQGVLYRASQVVISAHRNDPGEYKLLFRYLKLFGLMAYIAGDAEHGFTLTIDGPASLFTPSPRYGLALAKLLPALLHVTRWHLTATLVPRERWAKTPTAWRLEREVDLIPLPGSVMVPDFRLVHPDGRSVLLDLVGYWRPEYLRKKFA
jgi:uncharacterized protein